ncbi:MAG TPA: PilT/PilU family type 4a pilus ATPase [Gaiellaceae bacterium]|nr:PilT/PilU family type 4a pilus ATPase [Gaiellaceae bacterium]
MDLQSLLARAVEAGASDVHLKVDRPPAFRRDGALLPLQDWPPLDARQLEEVLATVTAHDPKRADAFQESGEFDLAYTPPGLPRFRVNGFRQRGSISFAIRLIPTEIPVFSELCLPAGVPLLAEEHRGLILCTGATGSGKSTTLAAIVGHINATRHCHIVTIEDPIEFLHSDLQSIVNQREVGLDTASFQEALRRALRADPDVILIGELRDAQTTQTAMQAAESGHLVLSTLHTLDAAESIGRIIEFFPPEKHPLVRSVLARVLRGVISQRLLPRVDGGRVAAVEVMVNNARIAELIQDNRVDGIPAAIEDGVFFKMQTFNQALIELVLTGQVEREVAASAATNRHDFLVALDRAVKQKAAEERAAAEQSVAEEQALRLVQPGKP